MEDSSQKPKVSLKSLLKLFQRIPPYRAVHSAGTCKDCTKWQREGDEIFISIGKCEFYGNKWDDSPVCKYAVKKKFLRR